VRCGLRGHHPTPIWFSATRSSTPLYLAAGNAWPEPKRLGSLRAQEDAGLQAGQAMVAAAGKVVDFAMQNQSNAALTLGCVSIVGVLTYKAVRESAGSVVHEYPY